MAVRKRIQPKLSTTKIGSSYEYLLKTGEEEQILLSKAQLYLLEACLYFLTSELNINVLEVKNQTFLTSIIHERYHDVLDKISHQQVEEFSVKQISTLKILSSDALTKWLKWRTKKHILILQGCGIRVG